jgi:tetratricopeptide (TPR) repeat protein
MAEDPKRLAEAAGFLEKAAELNPQNARMKYNLGLARQRLEDLPAAERALAAAYALQPDDETLYALAGLYAQQRRWPKAVACLQELAQKYPANRELQQTLLQYQQQAAQFGPAPQ